MNEALLEAHPVLEDGGIGEISILSGIFPTFKEQL
jgi:hypothetical protein